MYDPAGYMSANIISNTPGHLPPVRNPDQPTKDDYALMGQHILMYSGPLRLAWENSTTTLGRVFHGPLMASSRRGWLGTTQTRNYEVFFNATETGGRDILRLWNRNETNDQYANIYWVRAPPGV